jgi:hypothetical protein
MLSAYEKFGNVMRRCGNLMGLFEAMEKMRSGGSEVLIDREELSDLVRAAVVLAVSGMDSYFTDKFSSMIVPYLKKKAPNKGLVKLMSDAGLDTEKALELVGLDRPFRRIHSMVDAHLSRYTTQSVVANELFLCVGLKQYVQNAARRTGRPSTLGKVMKLVERRHEIVHEADLNSRGKLEPIEASEVHKQIGSLILFIESCEFLANQVLS